jgi:murein DD-endopeptidase MepM/ murein hydrolase activator NlpD
MTQLDTFPLPIGPHLPPNDPGFQFGYRITSYFGGRVDPITGRPGSHGGEDLGAAGGTPMLAVGSGYLAQGWDPSGGGNWSGLTLANGDYFGYGHASGFAPGGNRFVRAGETIAWVDSTGASTGNHLHFAYRPAGHSSYADPYDLLQEVAVRIVGGGPAPSPEDDMFEQPDRDVLNQINGNTQWAGMGVAEEVATFEGDTRVVVLNGVKVITALSDAAMADKVTQAGWASRDYAFCYDGQPETYMWVDTGNGRCRQWIQDQDDLADLERTKLNPMIVVFDPSAKARHDQRFPMVGTLPGAA